MIQLSKRQVHRLRRHDDLGVVVWLADVIDAHRDVDSARDDIDTDRDGSAEDRLS